MTINPNPRYQILRWLKFCHRPMTKAERAELARMESR